MNMFAIGVSINGGPRASDLLNLPAAPSFHHEYGSLTCTLEIVDDVHAAIDHIHTHGRQATSFYMLCDSLCTCRVSFFKHYAL